MAQAVAQDLINMRHDVERLTGDPVAGYQAMASMAYEIGLAAELIQPGEVLFADQPWLRRRSYLRCSRPKRSLHNMKRCSRTSRLKTSQSSSTPTSTSDTVVQTWTFEDERKHNR